MDLYAFMGTSCAWKVYRLMLPVNSSDVEIRELFKSLVRLKKFRLLLTTMGFTSTLTDKSYEDDEAITNSITSHRITPRLYHIDVPLCCMHKEHTKGTFDIIKTSLRIQLVNICNEPESGPTLLRNTYIAIGHICIKDLTTSQFQ